ncbi:hypothetical protein FB45DRAFT_147697 [Roridomyces roridus]|uniref:Uncharacterized protein n=1 Tax=Roridomyces roridus TaxID=1738132 RepID=A0AAD7BGC9_9AGAR|nr:hypothetical protein FB45DRAFT_147697 [Roridomyces roridus]
MGYCAISHAFLSRRLALAWYFQLKAAEGSPSNPACSREARARDTLLDASAVTCAAAVSGYHLARRAERRG